VSKFGGNVWAHPARFSSASRPHPACQKHKKYGAQDAVVVWAWKVPRCRPYASCPPEKSKIWGPVSCGVRVVWAPSMRTPFWRENLLGKDSATRKGVWPRNYLIPEFAIAAASR